MIYSLLGVFLLLGIWGQDAYATTVLDSYVEPGYHIIGNADHEAEVIAYRLVGLGTRNLSIKDTMTSNQEQYKVIRIVDGVFKGLKANDVSIAGSVKEIGNEAFASAKLTGIITIDEGVEVLGEKCFQNFICTRMKLPNSITTIKALAFHNTGVSRFKLPTALQSLAADAFDDADAEDAPENTIWHDVPLGQEVELATIKICVTGCEEKNELKAEYFEPEVAQEGTKFVVFSVVIENTTKDSLSFDNDLVLTDSQGRNYDPYSDALWYFDETFSYTDLAPNIAKSGVFVYNVPADSADYYLSVLKADTDDGYRLYAK